MRNHDKYCPRCDVTLNCSDIASFIGLYHAGNLDWCPLCYCTFNATRFPSSAPYCTHCRENLITNEIAYLGELQQSWRRFFADRWTHAFCTAAGQYMMAAGAAGTQEPFTLLEDVPTLYTIPTKPLPGQLVCTCNNCRRRF